MTYDLSQPFEVSYKTVGRKGKKERDVICVLCPTPIAHYLRLATPIFISVGDAKVNWERPQSAGYIAMFDNPR